MCSAIEEIVVRGQVVSGLGQGQYFTRLDWVREQVRGKFGFDPVPGTFNVKVGRDQLGSLARLSDHGGIEIVPPNPQFCSAKCFPVQVGAWNGVLVIPMVESYSPDLLEIMAPVLLRQSLGVKDGDLVEVRIRMMGAGR